MQNENSSYITPINRKISDSETLPDSFLDDLLDAADNTLVPITYDRPANVNVTSLSKETNVLHHPGSVPPIISPVSEEFCIFPTLTFGMEFSTSSEINLKECENSQEVISNENNSSELHANTRLKQIQEVKPKQELSSYSILMDSYLKSVSKENKGGCEQKKLTSIKKKRNSLKNEKSQEKDSVVCVQGKLTDPPKQSTEYNKQSGNDQSNLSEGEIEEDEPTQCESKRLNKNKNEPSKDETECTNSATKNKFEGSLADKKPNDMVPLQSINSRHRTNLNKSEKLTKDNQIHFEKQSIMDENIKEKNSDEQSEEYLDVESDEYIDIQSDEELDIALSDNQSDDNQKGRNISKNIPQKEMDANLDRQDRNTYSKNLYKLREWLDSDIDTNKQVDDENELARSIIEKNEDHLNMWVDKEQSIAKTRTKASEIGLGENKVSGDNKDQTKSDDKEDFESCLKELSDKQSEIDSKLSSKEKLVRSKENMDYSISDCKQSKDTLKQAKSKSKERLKSPDKCHTEKDSNTPSKKQLGMSRNLNSDCSETDDENEQTSSNDKNKEKSPNKCARNQIKDNSNIPTKKQLSKSKKNNFYSSESKITDENEQLNSKAKKTGEFPIKQAKKFTNTPSKKQSYNENVSGSSESKETDLENEQTKLAAKNIDESSYKHAEIDKNTIFKKRLSKSNSDDSENKETDDKEEQTKSKAKNTDELSNKQSTNISSKKQLSKYNVIVSDSKETDDEDEQIKSKAKNIDESSSKQAKYNVNTPSKKRLSKSKEIYSDVIENNQTDDKDEQTNTNESSSKQAKKDANTPKKQLSKSIGIGSYEEIYSDDCGNKETNDENEQTKSKALITDGSSSNYAKKDTNTPKKQLLKSKEIYSDDSEDKATDDEEGETKAKMTDECSSKKVKNYTNTPSKKCNSKEIDSDTSENKGTDDENKQTKAKFKQKNTDESSRQTNTFSRKRLPKSKEMYSDDGENKQIDDEDEQTKSKAKNTDESFNKHAKQDTNISSQTLLLKFKEIYSDGNQTKQTDNENAPEVNQRKSKARNKRKWSVKPFPKQSKKDLYSFTKSKLSKESQEAKADLEQRISKVRELNNPNRNSSQLPENNLNHNSENRATQLKKSRKKDSNENVETYEEEKQVDYKSMGVVKNPDESSCKQTETNCDKVENEPHEGKKMHAKKTNLSKYSREQKLKSNKETLLVKGSKKQSRVHRADKKKILDDNLCILSLENDQLKEKYSSLIKPCKIVVKRLENLHMYVPSNNVVLNAQKPNSDKHVKVPKSKLEKVNEKNIDVVYICSDEETSIESFSRLDADQDQSHNVDSKVLNKPVKTELLQKSIERPKAKTKKVDMVELKAQKNISNCERISGNSVHNSDSDEAQSEVLNKLKQKCRLKKFIEKSGTKGTNFKKLKKGVSGHNSDEVLYKSISKRDSFEAQLNAGQSEVLDKLKDQRLLENIKKYKPKQVEFDRVKLKGNKNKSKLNSKEISCKSVSKPDVDKSQSEELKEKHNSQNNVEKPETNLGMNEEVNIVEDTSDHNNEETSSDVFKSDTVEAESDTDQLEILNKPEDQQLLAKYTKKSKVKLKKFDIKFKGNENKHDLNSKETLCESESGKSQSEDLKQKQNSGKAGKHEVMLDNNEEVIGKDTSGHNDEKTSSQESVGEPYTVDSESDASQSKLLDKSKNKQLLKEPAEKSKAGWNKLDKGKMMNLPNQNSDEIFIESESKYDSDKTQMKTIKKFKQKQHSKQFVAKSKIKLKKVKRKKNESDVSYDETFYEIESEPDADQSEVINEKNGKVSDYYSETILEKNNSTSDVDRQIGKSDIGTENGIKVNNSFSKSKKRKFEDSNGVKNLKPCKVVIEQCNFPHKENNLNLDNIITLQAQPHVNQSCNSKKNSILEDGQIDISRNTDIHLAIANQYQTETNASVHCEDEVENEIIYLVQDDEDIQSNKNNTMHRENSEIYDSSVFQCIVAVNDQLNNNASSFKDDEEEENTPHEQYEVSKDIGYNKTYHVEDKCQNTKPTRCEKTHKAETSCNVQSQDSKSMDESESETGNDLNETSSNTKAKETKKDGTSTVLESEQLKEFYKKQIDSMLTNKTESDKRQSSDEFSSLSENVELKNMNVAQSKFKIVSSDQKEIKKRGKNSKLLNKNPIVEDKAAKSKKKPVEEFETNQIISDEIQVDNITEECVKIPAEKVSTNKLEDELNVKQCRVVLEKFSTSRFKSVDEADQNFLSTDNTESFEDEPRIKKKLSSKQRRLSHVSSTSKRKCSLDENISSDENLKSICSDFKERKKHLNKLQMLSPARFSSKPKHQTFFSSNEDLDSSCSDSVKSFYSNAKHKKMKQPSNKWKQSSLASSSIKRKRNFFTSNESCSDSEESSEDELVKNSRKKKQSKSLKPSRYAISSNKRKHRRVLFPMDKSSFDTDSEESFEDESEKNSRKKKQSKYGIALNKRKHRRVTSDKSSFGTDSEQGSEEDVKNSKNEKLSNKLKQLCLMKKHNKISLESKEVLDFSCSDSKKSSKDGFVNDVKQKQHSNRLKQMICCNSLNKKKRKENTSDSDEESNSSCSDSEESSEEEDVKIRKQIRSNKLKRYIKNLADDKIVRLLSCKSCKLTFKTYRQWVKHDKECHKNFVYKCDLCYGELFKSFGSYVSHMKYFHPYEKLFFCKYRKCKKSFSSLRKFRIHHKSHYKFVCRYCKEGFMEEHRMYSHVIKCHVK